MKRITISSLGPAKVSEVFDSLTGIKRAFVFEGDDLEVEDEYHSMKELYQHRMALNIALFNLLGRIYKQYKNVKVLKSRLHSDGTMFEGYFVVVAVIPGAGQASWHYKLEHWSKFDIPEEDNAPTYDGHTPEQAMERIQKV